MSSPEEYVADTVQFLVRAGRHAESHAGHPFMAGGRRPGRPPAAVDLPIAPVGLTESKAHYAHFLRAAAQGVVQRRLRESGRWGEIDRSTANETTSGFQPYPTMHENSHGHPFLTARLQLQVYAS